MFGITRRTNRIFTGLTSANFYPEKRPPLDEGLSPLPEAENRTQQCEDLKNSTNPTQALPDWCLQSETETGG